MVASSVVLLAAGVVAVILSLTSRESRPPQASAAVDAAARWIAGQVSHDASVACDHAMCDALTAQKFPVSKLQLIRPDSPYPRTAQVVVITPVVHRQFGSSLATDWAPEVLATFGTGGNAISVRIMAPHGALKYRAQLATDLRQRRSGGAGLLQSPEVTASPAASRRLLAGAVDTRLIVVLTALAAQQPIDILDFGTTYAGTSPGIPLRTADLGEEVAAAGMNRSDYLRFLLQQLHQQRGIYKPLTLRTSKDGAGKYMLQVTFAAPSPLLLLGGQGH